MAMKKSKTMKNIQVRLDEKLKNEAEKIFEHIGIDTPTAIRIFFVKVTDVGGIPFSLQKNIDHYSPEELAEIDAMAEEALQGKNLVGPFDNAEDLIRSLHDSL